jgi:hypothetical protein
MLVAYDRPWGAPGPRKKPYTTLSSSLLQCYGSPASKRKSPARTARAPLVSGYCRLVSPRSMRSATAAGDPWWARLVLGTGSRRALQRGDDSRGQRFVGWRRWTTDRGHVTGARAAVGKARTWPVGSQATGHLCLAPSFSCAGRRAATTLGDTRETTRRRQQPRSRGF